jgi:hypothetical protein
MEGFRSPQQRKAYDKPLSAVAKMPQITRITLKI